MPSEFQKLLSKVEEGRHLTDQESESALAEIMEGSVSPDQVKQLLLALRKKGETLPEIVGAARAMRTRARRVRLDGIPVIDTCGTGGDRLNTVNLSTLAALVAAGAGAKVAKHGNRSISSSCGSADLLEVLGVRIEVPPETVERCVQEAGFGFMFAPAFHPAMKAVAPVRKELGVPTIFNLLGPLLNPAHVKMQVVGVADRSKMETYARALEALGVERAVVVRGADGQDECSITGETELLDVPAGAKPVFRKLKPEDAGLKTAPLQSIVGGPPEKNAEIAQRVLAGEPGPVLDAVLLNAGLVLTVSGVAANLGQGVRLAARAVERGAAKKVLEQAARITKESA